MTDEALIEALVEYTRSNQALAEAMQKKVDLTYKTVFGDPEKKDEPGMLEVQRDHQKFIDTFKSVTAKGAWIAIGALILAGLSFSWSVIQHVGLGLP